MEVPQPRLLDGATATNLFQYGYSYDACLEEFILAHKNEFKALQADFISAGSDVIYTGTFGANAGALRRFNLQDKAYDLNKEIALLSKEIANGRLVAGDISSTTLSIAPYGNVSFKEVVDIYKKQAAALNDAGVDLFVIETMSSVIEARAAVIACQAFNKPIYVTFYFNDESGGKTLSGASPLCCLTAMQGLGVQAFGANCSDIDTTITILKEIKDFAKVPLIAKPSAGEPNILLPTVYDLSPVKFADVTSSLLESGATIIGGCCGTTPEHIKLLSEKLSSINLDVNPSEPIEIIDSSNIILSDDLDAYVFDVDRIEFSEPIQCEYEMTDLFLEAEEQNCDIILVNIHSQDDAINFLENAHLATLPICINVCDASILETVLYLYNGIAMVDSQSMIDQSILHNISRKYGAIVY